MPENSKSKVWGKVASDGNNLEIVMKLADSCQVGYKPTQVDEQVVNTDGRNRQTITGEK